uniref:Cytochrome b561 domain-containing protein n=1 Tax=Psilocybe cubensis TaxID=181762 RepID=A0A8H7Y5E0_PSICU
MPTSPAGVDNVSVRSSYELEHPKPLNIEQRDSPSLEQVPSATGMGYDQSLKSEGRPGDAVSRQTALVIMATTWTIVLMNAPMKVGWFAFHPPLQSLAILLFTFGIITLQPTNQPKTKAAGLMRHQLAIFVVGFPTIALGTIAVSYNKWLRGADHFTTWHGFFGIITMAWLVFQIFLGAGSVWYGGALFGGGMKAKSLWKYHRLHFISSAIVHSPSWWGMVHMG